MPAAHGTKLKVLGLKIDGDNYECQLRTWNLDPGIPDGDTLYTYCADGAVVDDGETNPTLQLTFLADWRTGGISRVLWENNGAEVPFILDHHPDIPGEHVQWTGTVKLKAPPTGGENRAMELTEITLKCVGDPVFNGSPA